MLLTTVTFIVLIGFIIIAFGEGKECSTPECKHIEKMYKLSIDKTINPCEDFFSHVCSGWIKQTDGQDSYLEYTMLEFVSETIFEEFKERLTNTTSHTMKPLTKLEKEISRYYSSCMDVQSRSSRSKKDIQTLFDSLGGFPLFKIPLRQNYNWKDAVARAYKDFNLRDIFLDISTEVDAGNTSNRAIVLKQPSNVIQTIDYEHHIKEVKDFMLYFGYAPETICDEVVFELMNNIAKFEKLISTSYNTAPGYSIRVPFRTIKILPETTFEVTGLLKTVFDGVMDVTDDTEVVIYCSIDYLEDLEKFLSEMNVETISAYIGWKVLKHFDYRRLLVPVMERPAMESLYKSYCWKDLSDHFEYAVADYFLKSNGITTDDQDKMEEMFERIKESYIVKIIKSPAYDGSIRNNAIKKIKGIKLNPIGPDFIFNENFLNTYYGQIPSDSYFNAYLHLLKLQSMDSLRQLYTPLNRKEQWPTLLRLLSPYNSVSENSLYIPFSVTSYPFYQKSLPPAVNFGALGSMTAQQAYFAINEYGNKYNEYGKIYHWWDSIFHLLYDANTQCYLDQYKSYKTNHTMDNMVFPDELDRLVANDVGLDIAYRAYRRHTRNCKENCIENLEGLEYTGNQLFFIAYAYSLCADPNVVGQNMISSSWRHQGPMKTRVNYLLSNNRVFANTFSCGLYSKMRAATICGMF